MVQLLEVAIGLIFAFTLVSLAASTVNEWVSALLAKRGKLLYEGLKVLVGDALGNDVWSHGLIRGMAAPEKEADAPTSRRPSHVPSTTFVQALMAVVVKQAGREPGSSVTFADIEAAVRQLPEGDGKAALLALAQDAEGKIDDFKKKTEQWFEAGMERVSAQYKRWTQRSLFVIGFTLAALVGVDTLYLARQLWLDDDLRQKVVEEARVFADSQQASPPGSPTPTPTPASGSAGNPPPTPPPDPTPSTTPSPIEPADLTPEASESPTPTPALANDSTPAPTPTPTPTPTPAADDDLEEQVTEARERIDAIAKTSLPLVSPSERNVRGVFLYLGQHLLGFLFTALASCLGAPFWFDLLNKVINLRLGGPVSAEHKDK